MKERVYIRTHGACGEVERVYIRTHGACGEVERVTVSYSYSAGMSPNFTSNHDPKP